MPKNGLLVVGLSAMVVNLPSKTCICHFRLKVGKIMLATCLNSCLRNLTVIVAYMTVYTIHNAP